MNKCKQCNISFEANKEDIHFSNRISPNIGGKKYAIPMPTLCPDCRHQKRIAWRNERCLYKRSCDKCQTSIISLYKPPTSFPVYCSECWWGDGWSAHDYGQDIDFSKPFFEQFQSLIQKVPRLALVSSPDARENNCEYINFAGHSKNCFMIFDSDFNEDSFYSNVLKHSKNCLDCSYVRNAERCYECVDCSDSYELMYSQNCINCSQSYFLKNCTGCKHCVYCSNLNHKEYYIRNKPYTKEAYFKKLKELNFGTRTLIKKAKKVFHSYKLKFPQKAQQKLQAENCIGNYIYRSKNCYECFSVQEAEDLRYCDSLFEAKNCMDVSAFGEKIENVYNSGTIGIQCNSIYWSFACVMNCSDLFYCLDCRFSKNMFFSASVTRGECCIFNKPYSKEEYFSLVDKIIHAMKEQGIWGQFFPEELSPFCYNETIAQEHFPLTKEEVLAKGHRWMDKEKALPIGVKNPAETIPEDIQNVELDHVQGALACERCKSAYKIIPQEFSFYDDLNIPVPIYCPDCRHEERMSLRNSRTLYKRKCMKCDKAIQTTYAPESKETVYCEACYLSEVY